MLPDTETAPALGTPYPSSLTVAGFGFVEDVNVRLTGLSHDFPADIDMMLVGPGGQSTMLLSDVGAAASVEALTIVLDDEVESPALGALMTSDYSPTDLIDAAPDVFPAPAPATPSGAGLSVFRNTLADGIWSLYVVDDEGLDGGRLDQWRLTITDRPPRDVVPRPALATVSEDAGLATVAVRRDADAGPGAVSYIVGAGSSGSAATPGRDFERDSNRLVFGPGEALRTITVLITDDKRFEPREHLTVTLSDADGDAAPTDPKTARVTIRDDDPPPLRLGGKRVQRPLGTGAVTVRATSVRGARLRATGSIFTSQGDRIRLAGARSRVASGTARRLELRLRPRAERRLTQAFAGRRRLTARLTVTSTADGRTALVRRQVGLRD